jgi:hypothetical protein
MVLLVSSSAACRPGERAPERNFTTESLLMDERMFPPGWESGRIIPTADSHGAFEHPSIDIYGPRGVAVHEIYRYRFVGDARREYERQLDVLFPDTALYDEWRAREDLRAWLAFADEGYVACAKHGWPLEEKITNCRMLARYHEYVVRFSTQVIPPHLTFDDLAQVLKSIDDGFASAMWPQKLIRELYVGKNRAHWLGWRRNIMRALTQGTAGLGTDRRKCHG